MNIKQQKQTGFTLIEVLVSVVILAVGLLGLASLQMVSLRNNLSAQYRTQATIEAYSIVDKMRLNREVALAGGYDVPLGDSSPSGGAMAVADIANWQATLGTSFTGGQGQITTVGDILNVTVQWDDSRGVSEGEQNTAAIDDARIQQFVVSTQL